MAMTEQSDTRKVARSVPIVALDVSSTSDALAVVRALGARCRFYKVGLELYTAAGPSIVERLVGEGSEVFVDLKLHDIPNTVRSASSVVSRLGASLLTVHASGGGAMIRAAVEGAADTGSGLVILGVTVLTNHSAQSQAEAWGRETSSFNVSQEVLRLAGVTNEAGGAGIVCSGQEAAVVAGAFPDLGLLVPGIRLEGGESHDQKRVMTPSMAQRAGARWLILGRAVTAAPDPGRAMDAVLAELAL